jgi:microcystin-dependent protein
MAQPFIGEVRMFAGNFAPAGWMFCDGTLIPIDQFDTLFNLIGTTYGGDGQTNFALPDLRGRLPMHVGGGFALAQTSGTETVTLSVQQIPSHNHGFLATTNIGTLSAPTNGVLAQSTVAQMYIQDSADTALAANSIGPAGGNQPHNNFAPYLCINFIISMFGIFPTPN